MQQNNRKSESGCRNKELTFRTLGKNRGSSKKALAYVLIYCNCGPQLLGPHLGSAGLELCSQDTSSLATPTQ